MIIYILYYSVWTACCLLYTLFPINIYPPLSLKVLAIIYGLPLLGGLIQSPFPVLTCRAKKLPRMNNLSQVMSLFFLIWLFISCIELVSAKSLPIFSLGSNNYAEYGTKGIGGFLNALGLVFAPYYFYVFVCSKRFRSLLPVITLLSYQILALRRGHVVSFGAVIFFSSYMMSTNKKLYYILGPLLALGAIVFFGVSGDLRGNVNPFFGLYSGETADVLYLLPSGFTWFLAYFTGPVGNLSASLDPLLENCDNYFYPLWQLMPSPIKSFFGLSELGCQGVELINISMNVGTYLMGILQSSVFAPFSLAIIIYAIRSSCAAHRRAPSILSASAISILAYCTLASVFSESYFLPTYALSVVILLYLSRSPYLVVRQ
jgi:hypothetical protein